MHILSYQGAFLLSGTWDIWIIWLASLVSKMNILLQLLSNGPFMGTYNLNGYNSYVEAWSQELINSLIRLLNLFSDLHNDENVI